ncbi:MAG: phosphotransferase [Ignavibacteriales bacterium]|nr:phosphotransferase [Ignavibacteriales bacterium]
MSYQNELKILFENWSGEKIVSLSPLPESGSPRKYFRFAGTTKTAIGVFNSDKQENKSFIYLTKHFLKNKLNVPKIYNTDLNNNIYLIEDLGDETLFSFLEQSKKKYEFNDELKNLYKKVIEQLPRFQITAAKKIDYTKCYPVSKFDKQSMMWDLNYFKYYFLKLAGINFDEQKLENDFNTLADFLLKADCNHFMYRDFNPRNVMIKNNQPYFIDYQGGRKGALQYDIASFLFSSKADLPFSLRDELLEHYISSARKLKPFNKPEFLKYYDGYVLIRILQMFGAYGYRGYYEGKAHFLKSIPYAVKNLEWLLKYHRPKIKINELFNCLKQIVSSDELKKFDLNFSTDGKLTVLIYSFSYRQKIPADLSGNGGGFVFDCRAIPNPGRIEKYKPLNGRDKPVQDFLDAQPEVQFFLKESFDLVDKSVENYIAREWTDLMINYGCTGGQHRSVYCAEKLVQHLSSKYKINVKLIHSNLEKEEVSK